MESTRVHGQSSSAHQGTQAARSRQGGSAQAQGADAAAAQAGGFMAFLAAWDPESPAGLVDADEGEVLAQDTGTQEGVALAMQPMQPMQPDGASPAVLNGAGHSAAAAQGPANLPGLLPQGSGLSAAATPLGDAVAGGIDGRWESLVAQTARMDAGAGDGKAGSGVPDGEAAPGKASGVQRKGAGTAWRTGGGAGLGLGVDMGSGVRPTLARFAAAGDGLGSLGSPALGVGGAAAWGGQAMAGGAVPSAEFAPDASPAATSTALLGDVGMVRAPFSAREGGSASEASSGNPWSGTQATAEAAAVPAGEVSAEGAADAFADAIADEILFWADQNLQKAELTISHDGVPVDVSVALQGNQAHVSFVADHAKTRELLDAGQAQLRELLQQHGLELAGVSVGLAAQQGQENPAGADAGAQGTGGPGQEGDGKERSGAVRTGIRVLTDRAVDLYV